MPSTEPSKRNSATSCAGQDGRPEPVGSRGTLRVPARIVLAALRAYKVLLSPLFAGSCRFTPSCSEYMADAVRQHGVLRGGWLGLGRLARCHPFGKHGWDPVPPAGGTPEVPGT